MLCASAVPPGSARPVTVPLPPSLPPSLTPFPHPSPSLLPSFPPARPPSLSPWFRRSAQEPAPITTLCAANPASNPASAAAGGSLPGVSSRPAPPSSTVPLEPLCAVSTGNCHTLLLGESGAAFSCGYGGSGRLGLGQPASAALHPTALPLDDGTLLARVAAGTYHSLMACRSGHVYSCGEGGMGQLGHGDELDELRPRKVEALAAMGVRISMVAAGRLHSVALSEAGAVYSWGAADDGRLGHGAGTDAEWLPRPIASLGGRRICEVACVWDHTLALTMDGVVFSWGLGNCGQLGHGTEEQNESTPREIEGLTGARVASVAAGAHHCFAVATNGCLFGWGVGKTTEDDRVSTLGLCLDANQCEPIQYGGLRVGRLELPRARTRSPCRLYE